MHRVILQKTMEQWRGRVAVVTGSSSGIGAAIAKALVQNGMLVAGFARRKERVQELAEELQAASGKLHAVHCDVTKEEDILAAFQWVKEKLGGADVLINNAGVFFEANLDDGSTEAWRKQIETNLLALSICTREMLQSLKERGKNEGHVVHINSVAGHYPPTFPGAAMYNATKHGVTALTEGLRRELTLRGSKVKVTSISPGLVKTEIISGGNVDILKEDFVFSTNPYLEPEDVSDAVLYVLGTPPRVQVHELMLRPLGEQQ